MSGLSSIEKISVFCCFFDRFFALAIAALVFQPIGDFLVILLLILGLGDRNQVYHMLESSSSI